MQRGQGRLPGRGHRRQRRPRVSQKAEIPVPQSISSAEFILGREEVRDNDETRMTKVKGKPKSECLSTPFHKYDHVCGEGFSAQTRRERRAYPFPTRRDKARATTSGPKRTAARRVASLFGSGVVAPRSSRQVGTGDAPSSRLARTEKHATNVVVFMKWSTKP